uniref:Cell surface hydrophobicity-associated protein n=1 Tax=Ganoderma boninense TaxID=34458 RepID=A0A5K1JTS9_9APHY
MKAKTAIVAIPAHSASPTKPFASRYRSTAPSPSCKPQAPQPHAAEDDSFWDSSSCILRPLPDTWNRHAKAFATLEGALTLNESELRALHAIPRSEEGDAEADGEQERGRERPATRSQAALGRKIEFALRASRKAYLRKYGVPLYALLCASEDALQKVMVGGSACSVAGVGLRRVRIRFVWPQSPTVSPSPVMYEQWVRIDESTTKVQLGMLVAKVFYGFLTQKTAELSREQTFEWRVRPDALYRTWLTRLERVETNVFIADLRYALNDP